MSNIYHKLPSELLGIECKYTAYCLDEACLYIMSQMEGKDKIKPKFKTKESKKTKFKSFTELYASYNLG